MLFLNVTFETHKKNKALSILVSLLFHKSALQLKSLPCVECKDKKAHRMEAPRRCLQGQGLLHVRSTSAQR